ncbi:MAG: enoyl-CoA hydratase-related protein [Saccharospirillum sp.]
MNPALISINTDLRPGVARVQWARPNARNALNTQLLDELATTLEELDHDETVRVVVISGADGIFAAGADVRELAAKDAVGLLNDDRPRHWKRIRQFSKPLIASVEGYALGGGCELAMLADLIVAARDARFGQPEINLGLIPGAGGTQRLTRAVGKSLAMQMVLAGTLIDAERAQAAGLIAEVTDPGATETAALDLAEHIATKAPLSLRLAKAAVLRACEVGLNEGLDYERQAFVFLGATEDRNEGIDAFLTKRTPNFKGY